MLDTNKIMNEFDQWVEGHPWARGGYVPADLVTRDHASVLSGQVNQGPDVFAVQQVRSEISELVHDIVRRCPNFDCALEIGLGNFGGTHTLWSMIFDRVVSVELDHVRVDRFNQYEPSQF